MYLFCQIPLETETITTITNLLPFTIYYISVTACTVAGCNTSDAAGLRTGEFTPEGVTAPVADSINARDIVFTWIQPTKPNGIIVRYEATKSQFLSVCPLLRYVVLEC